MGREHVNFTEWDGYDAEELDEAYEEIVKEIERGEMPLTDYLLVHRNAQLTTARRPDSGARRPRPESAVDSGLEVGT